SIRPPPPTRWPSGASSWPPPRRRSAPSAPATSRPSGRRSTASAPPAPHSENGCNARSIACARSGGRSMTSADLATRARRGYELGRLRRALAVTPAIAAATVAGTIGCGHPLACVVVGSVLWLVAVGLRWRGGAAGAAVLPGLLAGVPALLVGVIARRLVHACADGVCWQASTIGFVAGLA